MQQRVSEEFAGQLLDFLVDHTHLGVVIFNPSGDIVSANRAFTYLTGFTEDHLPGHNLREALLPSTMDAFLLAVDEAKTQNDVETRVTINAANGLYHNCCVRILNGGSSLAAIFTPDEDMGAYIDSVTGADTPERFYEELTLELYRSNRYQRPMSVIKCEVDGLEKIFQHFGVAVGERVLALVGFRLRHNTRRSDLVARVSSNQFGVLLPETKLSGALTAAEKLSQVIKEIVLECREGVVRPTASFGVVATTEGTVSDPRILVDSADWALSVAKSHGTGRIEAAPSVAYRKAI